MENSLTILKRIVQESASAASPTKQMAYIVSAVRAAMHVSVCSLYIANDDGALTLTATDGLDPESVGRVMLPAGEGLVGAVARSSHPINLEDAEQHPDYRYFPETHEERYQAFLGVPLVHLRRQVGVLVVQESQRRKFTADEEAFLVTIAAQLAGTLFLDRVWISSETEVAKVPQSQRVIGVKGAVGIGIGTIHLLVGDDLDQVLDQECYDVEKELEQFRMALNDSRRELEEGSRSLAAYLPEDVSSIFSVYALLLDSEDLIGGVENRIRQGNWAPGALRATISEYADRFEKIEDPYLRARSEDVRNIGSKIYSKFQGTFVPVSDNQNLILTSDIISIADISKYKREQLAAIVCYTGSVLSHTAILASALGIPAVMGTGKIKGLQQGTPAIVDGHQGQVILNPTQPVLEEFQALVNRESILAEELEELKDLRAITPDGHRVSLYANTGLMADITPGLKRGAEGVGLYRSEIPFMAQETFPTEDEQQEFYHHVLEAYTGKPVTIRTLDIGGDKALPYYRFSEDNPCLGWRGIRFSLDNMPIFMTQVRAMLRA